MPASKSGELSPAELEQRGKANLKHGAGAAEVALTAGTDFTGLAREAELKVAAELETEGARAVYVKRTARLQACSDLYWQAICGAKDMVTLDRYVQRWAWLQASALRATQQVIEFERQQPGEDITDLLSRYGNEDR